MQCELRIRIYWRIRIYRRIQIQDRKTSRDDSKEHAEGYVWYIKNLTLQSLYGNLAAGGTSGGGTTRPHHAARERAGRGRRQRTDQAQNAVMMYIYSYVRGAGFLELLQ